MEFEIREVPSIPTLCVRARSARDQIGATLTRIFPLVGAAIHKSGTKPASPPYCRYLAMDEDGFELEGGMAVTEAVTPQPPVESATLGGRCAFGVHVGPYENLKDSYDAMGAWIRANGMEPSGAPWDLYIDDPGEVAPEAVRTEMYWPV